MSKYIANRLTTLAKKSIDKMTIRIQAPGFADWILARLGKQRAAFIPVEYDRYGYYIARRENLLRALFRASNKPPPEGWVYWVENDEGLFKHR